MTPLRSVILCATPRSGSTLLCDLLTATGVCGVTQSWFRRLSIDNWIRRFGLETPRTDPAFEADYLAAALTRGTDSSGTFGLRMMWDNVPELSAWLDRLFPGLPDDLTRIEHAFGPTRFICLSRKDRVAQAVSRLRAEQSGLWHLNADGSERERAAPHADAVYDASALSHFIAEAENSDGQWHDWFAQNGIVPAYAAYENLAEDPGRTLAGLLEALGRDPAPAHAARPATARIADAQSIEWARRYRAETGYPEADSSCPDKHV